VDDIQYDRGQKVKMQLDQIVDTLNSVNIPMALIWLWVWDVIRDKYTSYETTSEWNDFVITKGVTLDTIWEKLWENPPSEFTLEYGAEYIDEAIQDWMIDNDFLSALEEDNWLDDEDSDDVQSDNTTEYGTQEADFKAEPVVLEGSTQ
jgi:hypothetical protein